MSRRKSSSWQLFYVCRVLLHSENKTSLFLGHPCCASSGSPYTLAFTTPHNKKSHGVMVKKTQENVARCDGGKDTRKSRMVEKTACFFKLEIPLMNTLAFRTIFFKILRDARWIKITDSVSAYCRRM